MILHQMLLMSSSDGPNLEVSDDVLSAAEDVLKRSADDATSSTARMSLLVLERGLTGVIANSRTKYC